LSAQLGVEDALAGVRIYQDHAALQRRKSAKFGQIPFLRDHWFQSFSYF